MPGSMRTPRRGGSFLQHGDRENSTKKHDTQQCKTVSVAHEGGLFLNGLPDRNHRSMHGTSSIRRAMRHEILLHPGQPLLGRGLQRRDVGVDDERMVNARAL